jgi:NAD(P)H-quinone oxidoreductase subunit 5
MLVQRDCGPVANPSAHNVALAMGIAITIYALVVLPLGSWKSPPGGTAVAQSSSSVWYLMAQGLAANAAPRQLGLATARASGLVRRSYLAFQWVPELTAGTLPPTPGWVCWNGC